MRLLLLFLLLFCSTSHAALIEYSGTFNANFNGTGSGTPQGVTNINGSWSFLFDDSIVIGNPGDEIYSTTLTNLIFSPDPLGATSFGLGNTGVDLTYRDGSLNQIFVYGDPNGSGSATSVNFDDFGLIYFPPGNLSFAVVSTAAVRGSSESRSSASGMYTASPVPVPAAVWLFGSGLLGLLTWSKRQNHKLNYANSC